MHDDLLPIEAISSIKRRKKLAEAYSQLDLPSPFAAPFAAWPGFTIPHVIQGKFLNLISEGGRKVIETTLENDRRNRAEKHLWAQSDRKGKIAKEDYSKRIHRQTEQKNFIHRSVDKIQ